MKNKKSKKDELDFRRLFYGSVVLATILLIASLGYSLKITSDFTIDNLIIIFPKAVAYILEFAFFYLLFIALAYLFVIACGKGVFSTAFHLLSRKIANNRISKNAQTISEFIRPFLFEILKRNNSVLSLKLGQDMSSLLYNGYYIRNDCVFYRFIIVTDRPSFEEKDLKKILQSLIISELESYGIFGLSPIYKGMKAQYYSVYLDRIFFDESNSTLTFDLLYICSESSARYLEKAINRDNVKPKSERTVYDDEL